MNRLLARGPQLLDPSHALRDELLGALSDLDLDFRPGGEALSLREVLIQQGTFQAAYTRAFQTFTLRFDVAAPEGLSTLADLRAWFAGLDRALVEALGALTDDDLNRPVDRGGRYAPSAELTFFGYRETLLILAAKGSVYLRALGRPLPAQLLDWVG